MGIENLALAVTDDFPINHVGDVHSGKVRSVYWLTKEDSKRLAQEKGYNVCSVNGGSPLGVMVIGGKISAFNKNWKAENGLSAVPLKGECLNVLSKHWFNRFEEEGLGGNHIVDSPHPLVWIVQKAQPIMVEAIARQYITGSMWDAYSGEKKTRNFCGIELPEDLTKNQRLSELLLTPTTKGKLGIAGLPEGDDDNLTRDQILEFYKQLGFSYSGDVDVYERMLRGGFELIANDMEALGQIFVDTKFEFGYVSNKIGIKRLIYIDEIGTLDSSRFWPRDQYEQNPLSVTEESKEGFRQYLIGKFGRKIMLGKDDQSVAEKTRIAQEFRVPVEEFMKVSETYKRMTEKITGKPVPHVENARAEILDALTPYGIIA